MSSASTQYKSRIGNKIKDARDREVPTLNPVTMRLWHLPAPIDTQTLDRILDDAEPGLARGVRNFLWMIPGTFGAMALLFALLYIPGDAAARKDLVSTIMNPVIIVSAFNWILWMPFVFTQKVASKGGPLLLLKHRRCAHCGYHLTGLPCENAEGITICPECMCAWNLEDQALAMLGADTESPSERRTRSAKKWLLIISAVIGLVVMLTLGVVMYLR